MPAAETTLLIFIACCGLVTIMIIVIISRIVKTLRISTGGKDKSTKVFTPPKILSDNTALSKQAAAAESTVDQALRSLKENRYFVFKDLIIGSASKSLNLTQIDHVLVSRHGIFCIETKSSHGNIYGHTKGEHWKQYVGNSGKPFEMNSPYRQNMHHVSSLKLLLSKYLRAPIHSYIAFPNAHKVVVDGRIEDMTPNGVIRKIANHTRIIYEPADVERIAKILAHAGTFREVLREQHITEVNSFINAKVEQTLKYKPLQHSH